MTPHTHSTAALVETVQRFINDVFMDWPDCKAEKAELDAALTTLAARLGAYEGGMLHDQLVALQQRVDDMTERHIENTIKEARGWVQEYCVEPEIWKGATNLHTLCYLIRDLLRALDEGGSSNDY